MLLIQFEPKYEYEDSYMVLKTPLKQNHEKGENLDQWRNGTMNQSHAKTNKYERWNGGKQSTGVRITAPTVEKVEAMAGLLCRVWFTRGERVEREREREGERERWMGVLETSDGCESVLE